MNTSTLFLSRLLMGIWNKEPNYINMLWLTHNHTSFQHICSWLPWQLLPVEAKHFTYNFVFVHHYCLFLHTGPWLPPGRADLLGQSEEEILQIILQHRLTNTCWVLPVGFMLHFMCRILEFRTTLAFIKHVLHQTWFYTLLTKQILSSLWGLYDDVRHLDQCQASVVHFSMDFTLKLKKEIKTCQDRLMW